MIHNIRIALVVLLMAIATVLVITYYYVKEKEQTESFALELVYQFQRECENEYFTKTGMQLDDSKKTQLLSLSYKVFYRGTQKPVVTTPDNPLKKFDPQLNQESVQAMQQSSRLLYITQLKDFCASICPEAAKEIK